jgi:hypothetical protein
MMHAIAAYRVAIGSNPDYAEIHSNLGNALREEGKIHCGALLCSNEKEDHQRQARVWLPLQVENGERKR